LVRSITNQPSQRLVRGLKGHKVVLGEGKEKVVRGKDQKRKTNRLPNLLIEKGGDAECINLMSFFENGLCADL